MLARYAFGAVVLVLAAAACGKGDAQSYAQAVELVCNAYERADADRFPVATREKKLVDWLDKQVSNRRARALLRPVATRDSEAVAAIRAAAEEAGLSECPLLYQSAAETELPTHRLPSVEGARVTTDIPLTRIVIDERGIHVDSKNVVELHDWKIDEDDMDGRIIAPLKNALRENALMIGSVTRIGLLADRDTPFEVLVGVITSAKSLGMNEQYLIVAGESELGALEIYLPSPKKKADGDAGAGGDDAGAEDTRLKMVSTVSRGTLKLWSLSGMEGSLEEPKLVLKALDDKPSFDLPALTAALTEIAARRWPDTKARPPESKDIAVMIAGDVPVQTVVDIVVAVRYDEQGNELFPRPLLATSFDAAPPE